MCWPWPTDLACPRPAIAPSLRSCMPCSPDRPIHADFKEERTMCVSEMGKLRLIDLSKPLDPATETRRCHLFRFNTGGPIPDFNTIIDITSHLGTHVECPYHHHDDWPDVTRLP